MPATLADREHLASFLMTLRSDEGVAGRVMAAVEAVPRRLFVPADMADPFADKASPIECGQTMPSARTAVRLVAAMKIQAENRVLEIGTGSGYVTALLAKLGLQVTTIDRYRTLLTKATERLKACGLHNVTYVQDDGRKGYPDLAPFDRIVVHGSFETLPKAFVDQMASQGILVVALGAPGERQRVVRHQKLGSRFEEEALFSVRLQPLEAGLATFL
ncbi:protein-L-isoaspartate(D-aspartate) O-methyltransferase [Aureimonas sp. AU12]|uniref:protein-L-isoaspartate(D-aspartate) O-methyltransferase n=1 Tax=Aureimonas sp. AU12 TaxID=1638161 RepID=UPI000786550F|nr:protein-L-isoaspartate(D-aspartate) O-methyltransferase [Aureimonas sp. AU12]